MDQSTIAVLQRRTRGVFRQRNRRASARGVFRAEVQRRAELSAVPKPAQRNRGAGARCHPPPSPRSPRPASKACTSHTP